MIKKCLNCGKDYECYNKKHHGRAIKSKRPFNSKNCSPKCSKEYNYFKRWRVK